MQSDNATIPVARVPRRGRSNTPERIDARTRVGRRARRLTAYFTAQLDKLGRDTTSVELAIAVLRAAEVVALSEHTRAMMLRGYYIRPDRLVSLERLADQSVKALGISPTVPAEDEPSISDYLNGNGEGAAK